jgi:hypothetical protein
MEEASSRLGGCQHKSERATHPTQAPWCRITWGEPPVSRATSLTVVGVENDRNAVDGSDGANVVGGRNSTGDGSLLLLSRVLHALAGKVGSATLAGLETVRALTPSRALVSVKCFLHDGRLRVLGSLEGGDNGARKRQSACFIQKARPWLFGPWGGGIGLSAARNLKTPIRLSPDPGACVSL